MEEYQFTKMVGILAGLLMILIDLWYAFLAFIGIGLGNALDPESNHTRTYYNYIVIFLAIIICGFITTIGPFFLKKKAGRIFYIGFGFILGLGFFVSVFISMGALGVKIEWFLLCLSIVYFLLGFLTKKRL